MHESIRAALFTLLDGHTFTPAAKAYDHVPQDSKVFPRIAIDTVSYDQKDTDSTVGALFAITIRVSSKYKGGKECADLLDQLHTLLHHKDDFTVAGAAVVSVYVEGSTQEPDAEAGELREGALSLAVLLDDIAP